MKATIKIFEDNHISISTLNRAWCSCCKARKGKKYGYQLTLPFGKFGDIRDCCHDSFVIINNKDPEPAITINNIDACEEMFFADYLELFAKLDKTLKKYHKKLKKQGKSNKLIIQLITELLSIK